MNERSMQSIFAAKKRGIREAYDALAPRRGYWIGRNEYYYRELIRIIGSWMEGGKDVLQFGCGNGYLLSRLNARNAVGIDLSPEMIAAARLGDTDAMPRVRKGEGYTSFFRPLEDGAAGMLVFSGGSDAPSVLPPGNRSTDSSSVPGDSPGTGRGVESTREAVSEGPAVAGERASRRSPQPDRKRSKRIFSGRCSAPCCRQAPGSCPFRRCRCSAWARK
jgi:hypothetical protein